VSSGLDPATIRPGDSGEKYYCSDEMFIAEDEAIINRCS